MNYAKPQIRTIGDAASVIQHQLKQEAGVDAIDPKDADPSYDLDE